MAPELVVDRQAALQRGRTQIFRSFPAGQSGSEPEGAESERRQESAQSGRDRKAASAGGFAEVAAGHTHAHVDGGCGHDVVRDRCHQGGDHRAAHHREGEQGVHNDCGADRSYG